VSEASTGQTIGRVGPVSHVILYWMYEGE